MKLFCFAVLVSMTLPWIANAETYRFRRIGRHTVEVTRSNPIMDDPDRFVFGLGLSSAELEERERKWDTTGDIACKDQVAALRSLKPLELVEHNTDCESLPTVGASEAMKRFRKNCFEKRSSIQQVNAQRDAEYTAEKANLETGVEFCMIRVKQARDARIAAAPTARREDILIIRPDTLRLPEEVSRLAEIDATDAKSKRARKARK